VVNRPWALWAVLRPPYDLHAGEAYVEGDIDLDGDVVALLGDVARFATSPPSRSAMLAVGRRLLSLPRPPRRAHTRRARLRGRKHSKARDRAAISFHYDLPHAFYQQFLDSRMVYSCAYFAEPGEPSDVPAPGDGGVPGDLDRAQERKLDLICRKLRLEPGQRLLDIGCGWGSLLLHAAERYGVGGLGVTLSTTQKEAADRRIAEAGLTGKVEVQLLDYRELDGEFDAVASIGMFEHVGPENLSAYFAAAHRLTRQGGLFLNHGITLGDPDGEHATDRTFVATYVFPDGGLVPAWRAVRELEHAGFELLDVEQLRPNYALTLRHWVRRLEANRAAAVAAASEADYRIWRTYMAGSAVSFEQGSIGVVQVLGSRGHRVPLGRAWMLPTA
jgi:cyclopropane-fatty-acyl-phospholipid synthase